MLWLNVDEQRTDWIEELDQTMFQDSITLDESMKRQPISTIECPVMMIQKLENDDSLSALIKSGDCESKAQFLCTLDLSKSPKVHKQPNFSCLHPKKSAGTNEGNKSSGRKKRGSNDKMDEKIKENKHSKISYTIY